LRMIVVSVEEGEVIVSEAGIYALGRTPKEAEALGRRLFKWLELPVVPLVLGGNGYREGVLHLPSLEALQKRPKVLEGDLEGLALWIKRFLKNDLEALAAWNRGERPRVRLLRVEEEGSKAEGGGMGASPEGEDPREVASRREHRVASPLGEHRDASQREHRKENVPSESKTEEIGKGWRVFLGTRKRFVPKNFRPGASLWRSITALVGLALLPLPFLNLLGFLALLPALYMVLAQTALLSRKGESAEWVGAFKVLLLGVPGTALFPALLGMPVGQALEGAVAWALLPAAVGALSVPFAPRGPFWTATRLYALVLSDLFPWALLLAPLALMVGRPVLAGLLLAISLFRFLPGLDPEEAEGLSQKRPEGVRGRS